MSWYRYRALSTTNRIPPDITRSSDFRPSHNLIVLPSESPSGRLRTLENASSELEAGFQPNAIAGLCPTARLHDHPSQRLPTRHGFASPRNRRRGHQQPSTFQPPLLFFSREAMAQKESTTCPLFNPLLHRIQGGKLSRIQSKRHSRNLILCPIRWILTNRQMGGSYALHPCSQELQLVDGVGAI